VVILETSEFIRRALTGEPIGLGERGEPDVLALREVERRCKSQTVKILGPVPAAPLEKLEQREREREREWGKTRILPGCRPGKPREPVIPHYERTGHPGNRAPRHDQQNARTC
jgi:antitoxin (DNA-binding transcriptional repressor) of toxin-antitoxin stability system